MLALNLHFNGANDSTTIVESSCFGHAFTCYGTAKLKTTKKQFGSASLYVDGGNDYISCPDHSIFNLNNHDFTISMWICPEGLPDDDYQVIMAHRASSSTMILLYLDNRDSEGNLGIRFAAVESGDWAHILDCDNMGELVEGTFYHVVIARNGQKWSAYIDGVEKDSATNFHDVIPDMSGTLDIGGGHDDHSGKGFKGYIDELQIWNGEAIWDANFDVPVAECELIQPILCLQFNGADASSPDYFHDSSRFMHIVQKNSGVAYDSDQKVFGNTSGYFPGPDDWVYIADHDIFNFGTLDFTIEFRIRMDSVPSEGNYRTVFIHRTDVNNRMVFNIDHINGGYYGFRFGICVSGTWYMLDFANEDEWAAETWYHIAIVRQGTSVKGYIDGVLYDTMSDYPATHPDYTDVFKVGSAQAGGEDANTGHVGHIDEFVIWRNYARWTDEFTPPAVAETAYPKVVGHFEGNDGGTVAHDSGVIVGYTLQGSAVIDDGYKKFGNTSLLCDNNNYAQSTTWADFNMAGGDFTLEIQGMLTGTICAALSVCPGENYKGFEIYTDADKKINFICSTNGSSWITLTSTTAMSSSTTFYHIAVVRNGSSLKLYVNGTSEDEETVSSDFVMSGNYYIYVGGERVGDHDYDWHGNLDEVIIYTGHARWTSNFTAPTKRYVEYEYTTELAPSITVKFLGSYNTLESELTKQFLGSYNALESELTKQFLGSYDTASRFAQDRAFLLDSPLLFVQDRTFLVSAGAHFQKDTFFLVSSPLLFVQDRTFMNTPLWGGVEFLRNIGFIV